MFWFVLCDYFMRTTTEGRVDEGCTGSPQRGLIVWVLVLDISIYTRQRLRRLRIDAFIANPILTETCFHFGSFAVLDIIVRGFDAASWWGSPSLDLNLVGAACNGCTLEIF
jgi:hypothetical protein